MSVLPHGHQYIGRCGTRAQERYLRQRTRNLPPMLEQRARLVRWLDAEPACHPSARHRKGLIVLNLAVDMAEETGLDIARCLDSVLGKLEYEQTRLPSVDRHGFVKASEGMTL